MKKVLFICSTGGHLEEMLTLRPLFSKYKSIFVTENNVRGKQLNLDIPVYFVRFGTRRHLLAYLFIFSWNIVKEFFIFLRFMPDVVITTGAHTSVPMVYFAKLFKKKVVYIESVARVHSKSFTGKLIEKKVDKLIVQWKEMEDVYENGEYHGQLL
ncbi:Oligosaccharide biosynthesis protein Alg14 like [Pilibacter termitis]|uniref:Oligosaccharide biosynthesis protein Alg14 like n=1 Tax=Pilibacter termitis TaxID=263852 RepID=A0A1T4QZV6_9ENTE|nr:PssD/Cps14F family polysaccharide biosynthesis glycosyltransferase [Pilibacter termitis]SKA09263.1 Oligosaccharide biosynthesis protein Alg14 like [Pilibacter termitis]